jgi:hypothetical protein
MIDLPRATLVCLLLVGACGDAPPDGPLPEDSALADSGTTLAPSAPRVPVSRREPLPLTEREVTAYLTVLDDFERVGERMRAEVMADTMGVLVNEGLLAASPAAQRVISRRGFRDLEHFHQVAYSIAAALQAAPDSTAINALPLPEDPEERKAMEEVRAAMGAFTSTQPAGNAELVARYRERILRAQAGQ